VPIQGDTDCDGSTDAVDALHVLRDVVGLGQSACIERGDVNCDGKRTAVDALGILRFVALLPPAPQNEPCPDVSEPV
jgi:hypothetical protein